jgi:hypothetical protein
MKPVFNEYCFHKILTPVPSLRQASLFHVVTSYLFKIYFNITTPSVIVSSTWSLSFRFSHQILQVFLFRLTRALCLVHPVFLENLYKSQSSCFLNFLHVRISSPVWGRNTFLVTRSCKILDLYYSRNEPDQVSIPNKTLYIILCIIIHTLQIYLLDRKWQDEFLDRPEFSTIFIS